MVALTIQGIDDIISAYLQTFGFSKEKAQEQAHILHKQLHLTEKVGEDLILHLDHILLARSEELFPDIQGTFSEKVAFVKFAYLRANGANQIGIRLWISEEDTEVKSILKEFSLTNAPTIKQGIMEAQAIELPHSISLFKKIYAQIKRKL